jgi:hypothetical protein
MAAKDTIYRALPSDSIAHMDRQRAFVADLVQKNSLKHKVTRTSADLDLLQEILEKKLLKKEETWRLQSLGVVLGDALIAMEPRLHWMEVSDEWGTDPALLYKDTTYQLNPLTMISKRVEDGEEQPFVHTLAKVLLREAAENGEKAQKR